MADGKRIVIKCRLVYLFSYHGSQFRAHGSQFRAQNVWKMSGRDAVCTDNLIQYNLIFFFNLNIYNEHTYLIL